MILLLAASLVVASSPIVAQTEDPSVQDINLDNGVYIFTFPVGFADTASETVRNEIKTKFDEAFRDLPGVKRVETSSSNRDGTVGIPLDVLWSINVIFDAKYVSTADNGPTTKAVLKSRAVGAATSISISVLLAQNFDDKLGSFLLLWRKPCEAVGNICPFSFNCDATLKKCTHKCTKTTCTENGKCIVADDLLTHNINVMCLCLEDNTLYEFSGAKCETSTIRSRIILVIIAAIAVLIIVILICVIVCLYLRRDRRVRTEYTKARRPEFIPPVVGIHGSYGVAEPVYNVYHNGIQPQEGTITITELDNLPSVSEKEYVNEIARPSVSLKPLSAYGDLASSKD